MTRFSFGKFFKSPALVFEIINNLKRQKQFIHHYIKPELDASRANNDGSLEENDFKKINAYYGLAVPAILGEAFCALRGSRMTGKERMASTCQGAMTGLFDDFFDKQLLTDESLRDFIEHPQRFTGNTSNERLFLYFYKTIIEHTDQQALMLQHLYHVYHAQVDSKKQAAPGLTSEEISGISIRKGGASVVFYRTVFSHPMTEAEEQMLFQLGGLMQISNDIFDLYKDQENGIQTLVTTAKDIREIRKLFIALLETGKAAAFKTHYATANIKKFLDIISLGIFSRCFVCLDQLETKQLSSGNIFSPENYSRKDMICDMDTMQNKWRSLMYHTKI